MTDSSSNETSDWEKRYHNTIQQEIGNLRSDILNMQQRMLDIQNENREDIRSIFRHMNKIKEDDISKIRDEFSELKVEIARLKIKAGIWGTLGASIPAAAVIIANLLGFV